MTYDILLSEVEEIKPEEIEHPWLKFAGTWADDPTFDEFQAEIERYRREIDAEYDAEYQAQLDTMKSHVLTDQKANPDERQPRRNL